MHTIAEPVGTTVSLARRVGAILLTLPLVGFGAFFAFSGSVALREWTAMSAALIACLVLIAASACGMVASGVWLLARRFCQLRALWIGATASAVCGLVLIGGTLAHVIPCSGPD